MVCPRTCPVPRPTCTVNLSASSARSPCTSPGGHMAGEPRLVHLQSRLHTFSRSLLVQDFLVCHAARHIDRQIVVDTSDAITGMCSWRHRYAAHHSRRISVVCIQRRRLFCCSCKGNVRRCQLPSWSSSVCLSTCTSNPPRRLEPRHTCHQQALRCCNLQTLLKYLSSCCDDDDDAYWH
jgi:hypothetical protein